MVHRVGTSFMSKPSLGWKLLSGLSPMARRLEDRIPFGVGVEIGVKQGTKLQQGVSGVSQSLHIERHYAYSTLSTKFSNSQNF